MVTPEGYQGPLHIGELRDILGRAARRSGPRVLHTGKLKVRGHAIASICMGRVFGIDTAKGESTAEADMVLSEGINDRRFDEAYDGIHVNVTVPWVPEYDYGEYKKKFDQFGDTEEEGKLISRGWRHVIEAFIEARLIKINDEIEELLGYEQTEELRRIKAPGCLGV